MKFEAIKSKVLETGKINPLINFNNRRINSSVNVVIKDIDKFFRLLLQGATINVDSKQNNDIVFNSSSLYEKVNELYSDNKSLENEYGAHSLYIATYFLKWPDYDGVEITSPLLTIPVDLVKVKKLSNGEYQFGLKIYEEKARENVALVQKLKDENVKINIPKYEEEMDVNDYLENLIIQADELGYKVDKSCYLGLFYNPRINIYNDLNENEEKIVNHPIILAINGDQSKIKPLDNDDLDNVNNQSSFNNNKMVVSCDGSQLRAINEINKGKSLVIQGPPGTGKSQTITNIIANCLANKKKVLFVAEKKAALDVVYNNLKKVYLDEFCLYLNSKSNKRKIVFDNIYSTLQKNKTIVKKGLDLIPLNLDSKKNYFETYYNQLHNKIDMSNLSLYDLLSIYVKYMNYDFIKSDFYVNKNQKDKIISLDTFNERIEVLKKYNLFLDDLAVDYYKDHLFYGFKKTDLSISEKNLFETVVKKILDFKVNDLLKDSIYSINDLKLRLELSLNMPSNIKGNWLDITKIRLYKDKLFKYFEYKAKYEVFINDIKNVFNEDVLDSGFIQGLHSVPSVVNNETLKENSKDIKKNLKFLKKNLLDKKKKFEKEHAVSYTNMLKSILKYKLYFKEIEELVAKITSDPDCLIDSLYDEIVFIESTLSNLNIPIKNISELSIDPSQIKDYKEAYDSLLKLLSYVNELNEFFDVSLCDFAKYTIEEIKNKLNNTIEQISKLSNFVALIKMLNDNIEIKEYIDYAVSQEIIRENLIPVYYKNYYALLIGAKYAENPAVASFSDVAHIKELQEYDEFDDLNLMYNIATVREEASDVRPDFSNQSIKSDVGILKVQKEKPTMYIKELFEKISNTLLRIKPIMMMSPLAVSTYLPSDLKFDVVIFDEASQILPEDAICSIYRSEQVVVCGDTQQLPPTDFFKRINTGIDNVEIDDDDSLPGNSLLELCNTFLDSVYLKWHYRSKNEELITFSNYHIYDRELITFPQSDTNKEDTGVEFIPTYDAIYGRGGARTNPIEASKVAELIVQNIDKYPERSLGVISFSVAQREEIKKQLKSLLSKIKKEDIDKYTRISTLLNDEERPEPFFIKNIENVQGDERDTIIFSICYGKDGETGEVHYNLGKLTTESGKKRINVAVSRSKINMKIVCSFNPENIAITKDDQTGLIALKHFLVYAKNKTISCSSDVKEKLIKDEVCENIKIELSKLGYTVDLNVGTSSNKVDLAVRDVNNINKYSIGIMVDGVNYKSCKTVRDREKLKVKVLEKLGWKIKRVWIPNYVKASKKIIDEILNEIKTTEVKKAKDKYPISNYEIEVENKEIKLGKMRTIDYDFLLKSVDPELSYNKKFADLLTKLLVLSNPLHIMDIAKFFMKFFEVSEINENYIVMLKSKIDELSDEILSDGNFYFPSNTDFCFRKSEYKREISSVYYLELADLIYKIIYKSAGIHIEFLLSEVARYCNYNDQKLDELDKDNFGKALVSLYAKGLIFENEKLIYLK